MIQKPSRLWDELNNYVLRLIQKVAICAHTPNLTTFFTLVMWQFCTNFHLDLLLISFFYLLLTVYHISKCPIICIYKHSHSICNITNVQFFEKRNLGSQPILHSFFTTIWYTVSCGKKKLWIHVKVIEN